MDPNLRNLKDFLTLYNKVTELCFSRCVDNFYGRDLSKNEDDCVDNCVNKFARFNQKMMNVYVEVQTDLNEKRVLETEENLKLVEKQRQEEQQKQDAEKLKKEIVPGIKPIQIPLDTQDKKLLS